MENSRQTLAVLARFLHLQALYLRQADQLVPTRTHYLSWLQLVHGPQVVLPPVTAVDPELPLLLFALPLFRQYVVSCEQGSLRQFIMGRLLQPELALFQLLKLPAYEHDHLLTEFKNHLIKALSTYYQASLQLQRTEQETTAYLLDELCGLLSPADFALYTVLSEEPCAPRGTIPLRLVDSLGRPQSVVKALFPAPGRLLRTA